MSGSVLSGSEAGSGYSLGVSEFQMLDALTAGTVTASKLVVVDSSKDIKEFRNLQAVQLSASTNIVIGSANISEADLEQIDDLTAGTVTASKAVVVSADKDASGFRDVTLRNVSASADLKLAGASLITAPGLSLNNADLLQIDAITAGTVAASKAVVVDGNKDASGFRNVTATGAITAGTSFVIGSADLNETDLEKLDGITDGTALENKALVLDGSKDASGIRDLSMRNVSASADVQLASASRITGPNLALSIADLEQLDDLTAGTVTASKAVVVDSNKDASGFRNVTATGAFIIGSANMSETDLEKLDGITNGTGAANKALVLSGQQKINTGLTELTASNALISSGVIQSAGAAGFAGGYGSTGVSINADGDLFVNGNSTLDGTLSVAGGYGSTGVSINAAGNLDMDGNLAVGEDDDGSDVKFFGDTAGRYFQWDASADAVGIGKNPGSGYAIDVATGHGDVRADAFVTYSDRTLKTNIQTMDTALEKVMKLEAVTYDKVATGKSEIGFIAQDVAKVVPEICALDENGEGRGIDYSRMSALLAGALKAQQEQIAQLKEIVAKLQK
tara:strand:- start:10879 stop:12576 length:1698 start_codon:yes stop_codon:yes gene_type:complete